MSRWTSNTTITLLVLVSAGMALLVFVGFLEVVHAKNQSPGILQDAFQFYDDDSTNVDGGTALAAEDTDPADQSFGVQLRLRLEGQQNQQNIDQNLTSTIKLQYSTDASGDCSSGTWTDVPTNSGWTNEAWRQFDAQFTDGELTTSQLDTADGTTHQGGDGVDQDGAPDSVTWPNGGKQDQDTAEWEWGLEEVDGSANTYWFRINRDESSDTTTIMDWTSASSVCPSVTTAAASSLTFTIDSAATLNLGTVTPGTRNTGTTRLKVDTNNSSGYNITAGRDRSSPATTLASSADPTNINISDTAGGLDVFDGVSTCASTDPWVNGASTGLGYTLWAADINKDTSCWGTGTTETDTNNEYAALQASSSASIFLDATSNSPNPSYASVGWSLDVATSQNATDYTGDVVFTATTNP